MYPHHNNSSPPIRRGLTLAELLVATAVMAIICVSFGTLALSVQMANEYTIKKNQIGQHGRVILQRIERSLNAAHATEQFPAVHSINYLQSGYDFPQAIAVWNPAAPPLSDYPRVGELVFFAADPNAPNRLLEIRYDADTRTAPMLTDAASWRGLVQELIESDQAEVVEISNLVRAGKTSSANTSYQSTLRFNTRHLPSDDELAFARSGTIPWSDLQWANSIHGSTTGLRQTWCRFEFQLVPSSVLSTHGTLQSQAVPFFGSSATYYQVTQ